MTVSYRDGGEVQRTTYETYQEGSPNSHSEDTCLTCQYRREREEQSPMVGVEGSPPPVHSDYEDEFAAAGLGRQSYGDDEEDTYDTTCIGIRGIMFTGVVRHFLLLTPKAHRSLFGQTDPHHSMAWGRFTFLGRVRSWDGLLALVRVSVCCPRFVRLQYRGPYPCSNSTFFAD